MADIRRELHEDVRGVVATAEAATDWRRYLIAYPWASLGAAFTVGYLIVPWKQKPATIVADLSKVNAAIEGARDRVVEAAKVNVASVPAREKGLAAAALGMLTPLIWRTAQGYALKYLEQWMLQRHEHALHAGPPPAQPGGQPRAGQGQNRPAAPRPGSGPGGV